jgi:hypothetical protein
MIIELVVVREASGEEMRSSAGFAQLDIFQNMGKGATIALVLSGSPRQIGKTGSNQQML